MHKKIWIKNLLCMLLTVVFFFVTACSDAQESKREPWAPYTDDMTPKDYYLEDEVSGKTWHFRIPEAYLPSEEVQKKLGDQHAEIHTGLPDLKPRKSVFLPRAKQGASGYEKEEQVRRNGLYISISGNFRSSVFIKNYLESIANKTELLPSKYDGFVQVFSKDKCRVEIQASGIEKKVCEPGRRLVYITKDTDPDTWRSYSCRRADSGGGCKSQTTFREMVVTYIFRSSELDRLEEFEQAVQTILERFYVDDSKSVH